MSESLYGAPQPLSTSAPKRPSLLEQIEGVFTAPKALFERLRQAPSWVPALLLMVALGLVVAIAWGLKVDADAMLRPILERNAQLSPDQIDQIITMQSKFLLPFGILGVLFGIPLLTVLAGLINWGLSRWQAEPGAAPSTFVQGLATAVVPGLIRLPETAIIIALCLFKPVGGLKPDQIAPTTLGYFIHTASPKLNALLTAVNPFTIANMVLVYLAMRYTMKSKPLGAALAVAIWILFILIGVAFAK